MIYKTWKNGVKRLIPICDGCGEKLPEEYDFIDAVNAKKIADWKSIRHGDEWTDLCPECVEKCLPTAADDFGCLVNNNKRR